MHTDLGPSKRDSGPPAVDASQYFTEKVAANGITIYGHTHINRTEFHTRRSLMQRSHVCVSCSSRFICSVFFPADLCIERFSRIMEQ